MESIEKLCDWLDYKCIRYDAYRNAIELANGHHPDELYEIADEIEREIAERYMLLPVDADGVTIHVGDLIEYGCNGERLEVTHIGLTKHGDPTVAYRRPNGTLDASCIGSECRHCKPRTLEDVLYECFHDCMYKYPFGIEPIISKYVAEIRDLLGVE